MSKFDKIEVLIDEEKRAPTVTKRFKTSHWILRVPETVLDDVVKKLQNMINKRKDWTTWFYEWVIGRMSYLKIKDSSLALDDLQYEENVLAMADAIIKDKNVNIVPSQKTIKETTKK